MAAPVKREVGWLAGCGLIALCALACLTSTSKAGGYAPPSLIRGFNAGPNPSQVAVTSEGNIWVANESDKLREFGWKGHKRRSISTDFNPGFEALSVDGHDDLFVAGHLPSGERRITEFNPTGHRIRSWRPAGKHFRIGGIDARQNSAIYLVGHPPRSSGRPPSVRKFNPHGKLLSQWGNGLGYATLDVETAGNGDVYVTDNNTIKRFGPGGSPHGSFDLTAGTSGPAAGIAIAGGQASITNYNDSPSVEQFDLTGGYLGSFGQQGVDFNQPWGIDAAPCHRHPLVIADRQTIQEWGVGGTPRNFSPCP